MASKQDKAKERLADTVRATVVVTTHAISGAEREAEADGVPKEEAREIVGKVLRRIVRRLEQ